MYVYIYIYIHLSAISSFDRAQGMTKTQKTASHQSWQKHACVPRASSSSSMRVLLHGLRVRQAMPLKRHFAPKNCCMLSVCLLWTW